jgi:hypothetical protein
MGIHGLFNTKIFKLVDGKYKPIGIFRDLGEEIPLKSLSGKRICIDASWTIYSTILAMEMVDSLTDGDGNITSHINSILNKVLMLQKLNIQQIWIFDSPKPHALKAKTLEKRELRRKEAVEKKYKNSKKIQFKLTGKYVDDIKQLLNIMGIMYIVAPEGVEAEQYGAYITRDTPDRDRFCEYMLTGDSDVLCFGGNLLRMETVKGKSTKTYRIYELDRILKELEISYEQFLTMCVTLGSDFADKSTGVAGGTVMKKLLSGDLYLTPRQNLAIEYFQREIPTNGEIVGGEYNYDSLIKYLESKKFNISRVQSKLNEYNLSMNPKSCYEDDDAIIESHD